jgi:hypothetical protein
VLAVCEKRSVESRPISLNNPCQSWRRFDEGEISVSAPEDVRWILKVYSVAEAEMKPRTVEFLYDPKSISFLSEI